MSARRAVPALLLVAALGLGGCAVQYDATSLGVPVTMAAPAGPAPAGAAFKVNAKSVHGLFGLVTLSRPSLEKALATQLVGGKAVAGVKIKARSRWIDIVVTGLTLGLIAPRTVTFEGVVADNPQP